jgi:outer membrane receptor for ferrienterochelin and colicin
MIRSRHLYFLSFFIFLQIVGKNSFSQNTSDAVSLIKGTVKDSTTHQPVEFANVVLFNSNKEVIMGTITSINGTFEFKDVKKGNFILCISLIGYKKYYSKEISINKNDTIDLVNIYLQEEIGVLGEVVVKSKKKLIQSKGDKLVYNAKADIGNKAGSATDVLRNAPMVTVEADGGIKLRGNSNIKVLINGLPSNIMAKNLKEALKSIPAGTIESIEVITTPSAKYEAEGAAGIINIITKKKSNGTNGSIDLTTGNLEQSMNAEISIAKEKFNYSLSAGLMKEKENIVSELNRTSFTKDIETGKLLQNNHTTQRYMGSFIEFSTNYQADSTQNIGTSISYWNDKMPMNTSLYNLYESKLNKLEYNQTSEQKNYFNLFDVSLNYQKKFKRKGQELQLIGQYSNIAEKSNYKTNQLNLAGQPYFTENGSNTGKNNDLSFQTDYSHPINKTGNSIIETGIRYGRNSSASDYSVFNNVLSEDTSRTDNMNYFQNIYAAYLSLKFETKNKWIVRPGLRYEATQLNGDLKRNETSFKASFDNWVPSILISKKFGEKHDIKLNYTERIRRPEIWDLNPYVNASDPRNLAYGNPHLRPEITRTAELGYTYSAASSGLNLTNSLFFNSNKNGIEYLSIVDSLGISRTTPQNIATVQRIGANTNIYMPINEKWFISTDIEIYHAWFESKALKIKNDANFYSISINSSYTLPADFTIHLSADYNNGLIFLQGKSSSYYTYRFSIGKELFNNKANLTVNINNPFQSKQLQRNYLNTQTFYSKTFDWHYNRSFTVSFSWRIGGFQSKNRDNLSLPVTESKREGIKKRLPNK